MDKIFYCPLCGHKLDENLGCNNCNSVFDKDSAICQTYNVGDKVKFRGLEREVLEMVMVREPTSHIYEDMYKLSYWHSLVSKDEIKFE